MESTRIELLSRRTHIICSIAGHDGRQEHATGRGCGADGGELGRMDRLLAQQKVIVEIMSVMRRLYFRKYFSADIWY